MPSTTRSRNPQQTRSRIEAAALELFAEKGVALATTRDIAERAGVAEGALYRHFRGRDELITEMFATRWADLAERAEAAAVTAGPTAERVAAIVAELCRLFDTDRNLFSFLVLAQHEALPRIRPEIPSPIDVLIRIIRDGIAATEIRSDADPVLLAAMIVGLIAQPASFIVYGRLASPMAQHAAALGDAARRLLAS